MVNIVCQQARLVKRQWQGRQGGRLASGIQQAPARRQAASGYAASSGYAAYKGEEGSPRRSNIGKAETSEAAAAGLQAGKGGLAGRQGRACRQAKTACKQARTTCKRPEASGKEGKHLESIWKAFGNMGFPYILYIYFSSLIYIYFPYNTI